MQERTLLLVMFYAPMDGETRPLVLLNSDSFDEYFASVLVHTFRETRSDT